MTTISVDVTDPAHEAATASQTYWRRYHSEADLARADALRQTASVMSGGLRLHIDLYPQTDPDAPVFLFNHGGGGYSRMFVPLALALHDRGYTVVLPDQPGQGLSKGVRGAATAPQLVAAIADAARWTRARFNGELYMGGGSVGGALTYMAAAQGAPVKAIVCHNLYDFGPGGDALALSRMAPLTALPGFTTVSQWVTGLAASLLPRLRVPMALLGKFEDMVDPEAAGFFALWQADPVPVRSVTLAYIRSLMTTPPTIPFERNALPVLVINPNRDRMTAPAVTRRNFDRLGGPKHYAELPYGHWAMSEAFASEWADVTDAFLRGL